MSKTNSMHDVMIAAAKDIAKSTPHPGNWAGWVIYLLEALDEESLQIKKPADFELTLAGLQDAIGTRLSSGRW